MSLFRRKPTTPQRRPAAYVRSLDATAAPALHPSQVRVIDWQQEAEQEARQLPAVSRQRAAYVPAASEIVQMPCVNLASPDASLTADITPQAVVESKTLGGHQDRARAWLRYSLPLCITFAIATTIAAVGLYSVPLFSFATGLTFFVSFLISYTVLLLRYWRHTPEGVALKNVGELWAYYRREQAHRHAIEREAWDAQRSITRRDNRP
jgi:hypothetical protein